MMGRGGFNPNQMMKQVQKMQAEMERVQEELANKTVEATAGGGMVRVIATGRQEIREIAIAPEAIDPEDMEMLQDTIVAAVNEALRKASELAQQEMARVTGGLKLPF